MRIRILLLLLLTALAATAAEPAADAGARILVTIHYDAVDQMHGDAVERYHRPHDYGAGPNADPVLDALAKDYGIVRSGGWPMRSLGVHCEVYSVPPGSDPAAIATRLSHDKRVDSAEPLREFKTLTSTGESYRPLQHALDDLDVDRAHASSRGRGVRIAVIDSGVDSAHPNLSGAVTARRDFSDDGQPAPHGTEVAGIIAARSLQQGGIVGVAPDAELLDLHACWGTGHDSGPASCNSYSLAQALDYAVSSSVDIINLSLAGPYDPLLARLLAAAEAHSICVVVAAPPSSDAAFAFPASTASVIVVGVSDDNVPESANRIAAPGTDVLTTFPGGRYDYASGSSLAAAHVSGVIALARALHRLTPGQIRTLLAEHAPLSAVTVLADAAALR